MCSMVSGQSPNRGNQWPSHQSSNTQRWRSYRQLFQPYWTSLFIELIRLISYPVITSAKTFWCQCFTEHISNVSYVDNRELAKLSKFRRRVSESALKTVYPWARSGRDISKNGCLPRRQTRKSHNIFPRALRRAILTHKRHSPGHSSYYLNWLLYCGVLLLSDWW